MISGKLFSFFENSFRLSAGGRCSLSLKFMGGSPRHGYQWSYQMDLNLPKLKNKKCKVKKYFCNTSHSFLIRNGTTVKAHTYTHYRSIKLNLEACFTGSEQFCVSFLCYIRKPELKHLAPKEYVQKHL